jgi:hypothetical protein
VTRTRASSRTARRAERLSGDSPQREARGEAREEPPLPGLRISYASTNS